MIYETTAFHTVINKGSPETILQEAPYLSRDDLSSYLSQGYYFWDNDLRRAEEWGKEKYGDNFLILNII